MSTLTGFPIHCSSMLGGKELWWIICDINLTLYSSKHRSIHINIYSSSCVHVTFCMCFMCSRLKWKWQVTHGFMLKRSLPASGFADKRVEPLLSVQVAAPPAGPLGDAGLVGLVGEEAFWLWISCICLGLETATDWERDTVTWHCDRVKERKEALVSKGETLAGLSQWEITEQPVDGRTLLNWLLLW